MYLEILSYCSIKIRLGFYFSSQEWYEYWRKSKAISIHTFKHIKQFHIILFDDRKLKTAHLFKNITFPSGPRSSIQALPVKKFYRIAEYDIRPNTTLWKHFYSAFSKNLVSTFPLSFILLGLQDKNYFDAKYSLIG